ncbi:unnamed protein product [Diatraea saccharalis]|uniref:ARID domain-containing protein n=1 Tax=Diatraea saccharalis TaxID=40085 RepID=A0A9N9R4H9_9NEOP|nr:unnamed protein product [Diatraea saccharalis]
MFPSLSFQDEVLAINDKVVVRAEDLLSWVCDGTGWRWGLRAVWRGACAPPQEPRLTQPLHQAKLDFSDVDKEKSALVDTESPGVVVFSYPRYCRYRALLSRLEGIQGDWLRDSLVAALGGYAAPTTNTRILYCKDTFEYPELEGHEFVCNELAPKLKGRPRGRRRRASPDASASPDTSASPERDSDTDTPQVQTSRRVSLRNGGEKHSGDEEHRDTAEDRAFLSRLRQFHKEVGEPTPLKDLSLRSLYMRVRARGGYHTVCRRRQWRALAAQPARARNHYERYLLPYEKHESRNGSRLPNGRLEEPKTIATIELRDSPHRDTGPATDKKTDIEPPESKEELDLVFKPAEELNREFLESLPKEEKSEKTMKITVKPVEKLIEPSNVNRLYDGNSEFAVKHSAKELCRPTDVVSEKRPSEKCDSSIVPKSETPQKLGTLDSPFLQETQRSQQQEFTSNSLATLSALGDKYNGHDTNADQKSSRPVGRSSLRAVRVKPGPRISNPSASTPPTLSGASSGTGTAVGAGAGKRSPTVNNFGIHRPPAPPDDDEIIEVPYKPKSPEIIDLDEYPESPQSVKKKKLDILKERGLEVTAVPPWPLPPIVSPVPSLLPPAPLLLNPAMQHQIMTQASLFQMYNIIPPNYNGTQPPKVIQATSIFGSSRPEKTVYGNPKDPFMPPPHVLHGVPVKPTRAVPQTTLPQDILDLTCKSDSPIPAVEIVRVPTAPSPSKNNAQNLSKTNYKLVDGKAVVGSNLEITLVNPKVQTPSKNRPPQKRSSNGKFMSSKTPTPPKESRSLASPSGPKKNPIVVPNYQINARDDVSPTSSTGSRDGQSSMPSMLGAQGGLALLGLQKEPSYMTALYNLGHMDPRQLAAYRDVLANQFRGYSGLLSMGAANGPPTTKN